MLNILLLQVKDTHIKTNAFASIFEHQFIQVYLMYGLHQVGFFHNFFSMLQCFTLAQCLFLNEISAILQIPT